MMEAEYLYDEAALRTVEGCTEAMRRIKHEKLKLLERLHALQRSRRPEDMAVEERDRVWHLERAILRLDLTHEDVHGIRIRLDNDDRLRYERMFVHVAREQLDAATHRRIGELARERVAEQKRRAELLSVGSAIPMVGASGAPRERAEEREARR